MPMQSEINFNYFDNDIYKAYNCSLKSISNADKLSQGFQFENQQQLMEALNQIKQRVTKPKRMQDSQSE